MHDFRTRQALNGTRVETDWQMRADTRKLVASINEAFGELYRRRSESDNPYLADFPSIKAAVRRDGNGIYLRIGQFDVDIDRHGNLLGSGSMVVEHVEQKDLLAPKPRASARSKVCTASRSPRPKT